MNPSLSIAVLDENLKGTTATFDERGLSVVKAAWEDVRRLIAPSPQRPRPDEGMREKVVATGRTHDLKTWPGPFAAVRSGLKPWELRLNDRDYQVGDRLRLREWCPEASAYSGEIEERTVSWMLDGGFGLPPGYVVMSLLPDQPPVRPGDRKPDRDAMYNRSDEQWEAIEDAIMTVLSFRAGHVLTEDDIAAIQLVDETHRDDEEGATEAYKRGREEGLRERGGDELVRLEERVSKAIVERATEKAMRAMAQQRADQAEFQLALILAALSSEPIQAGWREKVAELVRAAKRYVECSTRPGVLSPYVKENGRIGTKSPWAELCEAIAPAEDALSQLPSGGGAPDGWRPIETAPKDGPVLAYREGWGPFEAHWEWGDDEDYQGWIATHADADVEPTHWQPLPPPPSTLRSDHG